MFPYPDNLRSTLWPKETSPSQIHKNMLEGLSCLFKVLVQVPYAFFSFQHETFHFTINTHLNTSRELDVHHLVWLTNSKGLVFFYLGFWFFLRCVAFENILASSFLLIFFVQSDFSVLFKLALFMQLYLELTEHWKATNKLTMNCGQGVLLLKDKMFSWHDRR